MAFKTAGFDGLLVTGKAPFQAGNLTATLLAVAQADPTPVEDLCPDLNTDLGQRYLAHLLGQKGVKGDLFHLAAAYNGGPGNLVKWKRRMGDVSDPLLFIESLPSAETRIFVERVLTNFWIYRTRLGQPTPELDALAAGDWPQYMPLDPVTRKPSKHAQN